MKKLLTQPLVHFLALGSALFALYQWQGNTSADDQTVRVNRDALLTFMQYRAKAFNREVFDRRLAAMGSEERQALIDDYVREEVLYREAKAMELDRDDYVIKRRLLQKLEFITKGFIENVSPLKENDVSDYFEKHQADYFVEPFVTFTHVFFDRERHGSEKAKSLADTELKALNQKPVGFSDALQYGDRFPFHTNYVERLPDYVASHFGPQMADAIFSQTPATETWVGPFESPYGYHLVLLSKRAEGRAPELAEVYDRVAGDARQAQLREKTEEAIDKIVSRYRVAVDLPAPAAVIETASREQ